VLGERQLFLLCSQLFLHHGDTLAVFALVLFGNAHSLAIVDVGGELPAPAHGVELSPLCLQAAARAVDALTQIGQPDLRLHERVAHLCKSRAPLRRGRAAQGVA
jgi:hypothetical protein